jgi:hypothetical protein
VILTQPGATVLKTYHFVTVGAVLSVLATTAAHADTDLTGKWVGTFSGVQVEFPRQRGPFGQAVDDGKQVQSAPKFAEKTLQIDVDTQKSGLAAGTWSAGEFKQRFVCAQLGPAIWNCVDAGGRASLEVKSPTQIKVCYLDNREGAQGAGCGLLRKTP